MEKIPKRFWDDRDWAIKHYSKWVEKYPNSWMAIFKKRVVAVGKDLGKVEETARRKVGRKHIPVIFVESGPNVY